MQPACASPSRIGAGQRRAPGVRRRRRSRIARGCCTHARRAPTRCETRRAHAPPRAERRQRTRRHGVGHTVSCDTRGMSITARAPPRCWQSAAPMAVGAAEACGARMHTAVSAARALRRKGSPTALAARTRHGSSERWSPRSVAAGAVERHACGAVVACSARTRRASAPSDGPPRGPCPRPAHSNAPARTAEKERRRLATRLHFSYHGHRRAILNPAPREPIPLRWTVRVFARHPVGCSFFSLCAPSRGSSSF